MDIVNTLKNRYVPIFKLGDYVAWFKRGILPHLNCVNYKSPLVVWLHGYMVNALENQRILAFKEQKGESL
ncbi:MAG: hypothetical protein HFE94_02900 [Acutalibacter sp.]|nr:hypothetical protein [Acutalibacter sp.]